MTTVNVPILPWYGDSELELDFPASWEVAVLRHRGNGSVALDEAGFRAAFANTIGCPPIREGAKGKKEICILIDDISRATPTDKIIPYVLEELGAAGIADDQIRFIAATGAHGPLNGIEFTKKLGEDVMARFHVYNHHPFENFTSVGTSPQGTPLQFNTEVMRCDYKIGIGSIVPHGLGGFGGGSKIVLPGVSSLTTIDANHSRLFPNETTGAGKYEGNTARMDMNYAARAAGLDVKVDCIYNLKRQVTHLFVGDVVEEHVAGVEVAREYWATEAVHDCDIVVGNCFSKVDEMLVAPPLLAPLRRQSGVNLVLLVVAPSGQITHYRRGRFGTDFGGRAYRPKTGLPPNTKSLTIMQPYPDFRGIECVAATEMVNITRSWGETLQQLKKTCGTRARVAVVPDATVQYFPPRPTDNDPSEH